MEDRRLDVRLKESENLTSIKQKAIELKHTIESIRLDGTQTWREILKLYSLASTNIQYLQGYLTGVLEHRVLVPNYDLHEDPNYVPGMIASKLNDNIDSEAISALKEFNPFLISSLEAEDQVNKFNSFCHELRTILRK